MSGAPRSTHQQVRAGLKRRHAAERRFRAMGIGAVLLALLALAGLFASVITQGYGAFVQTRITLNLYLDPEVLDPSGMRDPEELRRANTNAVLRQRFPDITGRSDLRKLYALVSTGATFELADHLVTHPDWIGRTIDIDLLAAAEIDMLHKGRISRDVPEDQRRVSDQQIAWVDALAAEGRVAFAFNTTFFTSGDSRDPESAGILGAVVGSALLLLVTLVLAFPIGAAAAVYLEEFAPKNRWTNLIEVNINNLAAVPSIVFGLLGLAVYLNFFGLPRSAPLVGGMVLALMTLPTIIIAARASLAGVPPSIRQAALGVGASPIQTVFHHVFPLALPGILTGTIIGMSRALGESAPLLMIGMVAFVVDVPTGFTDPATALPIQVYLWSDAPERAFVERTAAATVVLLGFLIAMNGLAVFLRKRFEVRW
ncbi:MAG: phosphate ABC transporter permease PstA [Proteobacteria bacterium]|nr:phosphate ABC transporter permease PstA [Pseudomonadota bacterium]